MQIVNVLRGGEETAWSNDASRMGGEMITNTVRLAGWGAPGGVWVNAGGTATLVSPVFGNDGGPLGTDDLWVIVPERKVLRESCVDAWASAMVTTAGAGGPLRVTCNGNFLAGGNLLVSNMKTAALITAISFPNANQIQFAETSTPAGFSDAPARGGFSQGDLVFGARLYHFYIAIEPSSHRPALYSVRGKLAQDASGRPFSDDPKGDVTVQNDVEDLQVSYGVDTNLTGNPALYSYTNTLPSCPGPSPICVTPGLRTMRITVVGTSRRVFTNKSGVTNKTSVYTPVSVENHTPAATPDGYRRSIYSERVELSNMSTVSL
jgi:hypothetical protein